MLVSSSIESNRDSSRRVVGFHASRRKRDPDPKGIHSKSRVVVNKGHNPTSGFMSKIRCNFNYFSCKQSEL